MQTQDVMLFEDCYRVRNTVKEKCQFNKIFVPTPSNTQSRVCSSACSRDSPFDPRERTMCVITEIRFASLLALRNGESIALSSTSSGRFAQFPRQTARSVPLTAARAVDTRAARVRATRGRFIIRSAARRRLSPTPNARLRSRPAIAAFPASVRQYFHIVSPLRGARNTAAPHLLRPCAALNDGLVERNFFCYSQAPTWVSRPRPDCKMTANRCRRSRTNRRPHSLETGLLICATNSVFTRSQTSTPANPNLP